jgi:hypothetical protein
MLYDDPTKISEVDALNVFKSGPPHAIARALLGIALYGDNLHFAEAWCLFFLGCNDETISCAAAISIGHMARRTRFVDRMTVLPALEIVKAEGRIVDVIQDTLDDVATYCPAPGTSDNRCG